MEEGRVWGLFGGRCPQDVLGDGMWGERDIEGEPGTVCGPGRPGLTGTR